MIGLETTREARSTAFSTETSRKAIMRVLREELYAAGDLRLLANRIGVSLRCLQQIRSGETLWPHPGTMFALCHALGLRLQLVRLDA